MAPAVAHAEPSAVHRREHEADGRVVWFDEQDLTSNRAWYTRIGETLVVIETSEIPDTPLNKQILDVVASLRPITPEQLRL